MKVKTLPEVLLLFVLTMPFILACEDDCAEIACFTPPMNFDLELVDKDSNENLFENESFNAIDISVVNVNNNVPIAFDFINENNLNLIQISGIGWETELITALISVGETQIANLVVDAERKSENCCSFTEYNEISIENAEFELNGETAIYTIFVD
jgi:hypothetical protein